MIATTRVAETMRYDGVKKVKSEAEAKKRAAHVTVTGMYCKRRRMKCWCCKISIVRSTEDIVSLTMNAYQKQHGARFLVEGWRVRIRVMRVHSTENTRRREGHNGNDKDDDQRVGDRKTVGLERSNAART